MSDPNQISLEKPAYQKASSWLGTAGALAVMTWLAAQNSGYFFTAFTAAAIASLALLGIVTVVIWNRMGVPDSAVIPVAILSLITIWTGASIFWSAGPNFTLQELTRMILYLSVFVAVLTGGVDRRSVMLAAAAFVVLCVGLAIFALLAKISPAYSQEYTYFSGRLLGSLGYWNAMAIFTVLGAIPGLWFASSAEIPRWGRLAATAGLTVLGVTLFFTLSRGGLLIGIACVLMFVALAPHRLSAIYSLAAALIPAGLLIWYTVSALPSLSASEEGARIDAGEGRMFAIALIAAAAGSLLMRTSSFALPSRLRFSRKVAAAAVALVLVGGALIAGMIMSRGGFPQPGNGTAQPWDYNQSTIDEQGIERLASTSDNRLEFWKIGLVNFSEHPLLGTGGGTYRFANMELQSGRAFARDPHSLWVRFLSDQGIAGFGLLAAFVTALVVIFFRQMAWNSDLRRDGLYLSLLLACLAFFGHSSLEFNWALPAIPVAFFFLLGLALRLGDVCEVKDAKVPPGRRWEFRTHLPEWLAMAVVTLAAVLSVSLVVQLMGNIYSDRAWDSLLAGNLERAESDALLAHRLNYFAVDPLFVRSEVARDMGDATAARETLLSAIDRSPRESWLRQELALLEFYSLGRTQEGIGILQDAIDLDPQDYDLHILLHLLASDREEYEETGVMPPRPDSGARF